MKGRTQKSLWLPRELEVDRVEPLRPDDRKSALIFARLGYSVPEAISDFVNNSIAAQAKNVWIELIWNGKRSAISIKDDGVGYVEFFQPRLLVMENVLGFRSAAG